MEHITKLYGIVIFCAVALCVSLHAEQKKFVIVTASYNNKDWYECNVSSILSQQYDAWRLIYINDCSTDGTGQLVQNYIQEKGYQDRVLFLDNKKRRGHLANQYNVIHMCAKDEIIVILDGDDWFAHEHVLHYLNLKYQDPNVWMTFGQFWYFKRNVKGVCRPIPQEFVEKNTVRQYQGWVLSHLRTFYAGLYQLIKIEDLLYEGQFYPMFADGVTMYPMFEMAAERAKFISEPLCIYNDANQLSFFNDHKEKQEKIRKEVCGKKPYNRLELASFLQG
ncbi:MAG: glycosyltransferase family A protein [Candidatus Dependentiae bacterium]|nr:glycosyltransferase family A protein [Candidatus Dependentiae bacterium]